MTCDNLKSFKNFTHEQVLAEARHAKGVVDLPRTSHINHSIASKYAEYTYATTPDKTPKQTAQPRSVEGESALPCTARLRRPTFAARTSDASLPFAKGVAFFRPESKGSATDE